MKWYIASSWKNEKKVRELVDRLRSINEKAYDFTRHSFTWDEVSTIDDNLVAELNKKTDEQWYDHPIVRDHFHKDMDALRECDALVAIFPCGNSTHIEIGVMAGRQRSVYAIAPEGLERDLLYLLFMKVYKSADEFIRDVYFEKIRDD